ncbi:MAG: RHS repeat-associated core domain-containing protein [Akkermansiaceae bacterium]|jgi:RHS repeat-associated protein
MAELLSFRERLNELKREKSMLVETSNRAHVANPAAVQLPRSPKTKAFEGVVMYYGYRFYDPETGRWPSRDPIGERGGVNLYGFIGNNTVGRIDVLGMNGYDPKFDPFQHLDEINEAQDKYRKNLRKFKQLADDLPDKSKKIIDCTKKSRSNAKNFLRQYKGGGTAVIGTAAAGATIFFATTGTASAAEIPYWDQPFSGTIDHSLLGSIDLDCCPKLCFYAAEHYSLKVEHYRNPKHAWYRPWEFYHLTREVKDADLGFMIYAVRASESGECKPYNKSDLTRGTSNDDYHVLQKTGFWGRTKGELFNWKIQMQTMSEGDPLVNNP